MAVSTPKRAPADEQPTAEQLLVEVGRGNRAAFDQLYDRLAAPVYGVTARITGNPILAQDSTQETMLDVWRSAPRYNPECGSALTWTLTIAHRRGVDCVRSHRAAHAREWRVGITALEPSLDHVTDIVIHRVDSERIRLMPAVLTPLQRQVVDLVYYQGRTVNETANLLSVPATTVKSRLQQALHRLRDTYRQSGASCVH
jgi:RNA polymerase sigma-70 factor (ECF subfamily)